ncbi:TLC domain-containing protein 2-like [Tubulanus polymorphus]|uniref:TLC domain-containing protein 2-like n=1 Tax=Tubulanus polymorphus TaxID=672921 RepID=UPI003DA4C6E8
MTGSMNELKSDSAAAAADAGDSLLSMHNIRVVSIILMSFVCFQCIDQFLYVVFDKILPLRISERIVAVRSSQWRFNNIFISFIHSCLSGVGSVLCFYWFPHMAENMFTSHNIYSICLVSFSTGYFLHDFVHNTHGDSKRSAQEIMGHHVVVMACFSFSLFAQKYITYSLVSLLVEVNSIFLHSRQLMQIANISRSSMTYRLNSLVTVGTYIFFRISTLSWLTRWIMLNKDSIPIPAFALGSSGLFIMTVINIVLFIRLLKSDFFRKNKES